MEELISDSVSSFIKFLSEKEPILKQYKSGSILISFAVQINGIRTGEKINSLTKSSGNYLYYEHPEEHFSFLGINECLLIAENGIGRFSATEKKSGEWKDKLISNWETLPTNRIPLFIGGMKFTTEHPGQTWDDFSDSSWFIPEILLLNDAGNQYLLYNTIYSRNDKSALSEKLRRVLEQLFVINKVKEDTPVSIREISGSSPKDKKKWKQLVSKGLENILDKKIDKIVYSRKVEFALSGEVNFENIISKLKADYPSCFIYIFHQGKSTFFGATPEKLVSFADGIIEIDSIAGSAPRGNDDSEDNNIAVSLLKDEKNLIEHNIVTDHIKSSIKNFSEDIRQDATIIKKLKNIQHLWTKVTARTTSGGTIFSIINELFPTPAVCGLPKKNSLDLIKKHEGYHRGMYSGIIGWFNFKDEAGFIVTIRSGLITGNKLFVYAGSGIVADSDPDEEFKETELKLKPILSLFRNEN
ncbi:MAG: isochorismate synthase [Ignavibacteriaceae bacterium]